MFILTENSLFGETSYKRTCNVLETANLGCMNEPWVLELGRGNLHMVLTMRELLKDSHGRKVTSSSSRVMRVLGKTGEGEIIWNSPVVIWERIGRSSY